MLRLSIAGLSLKPKQPSSSLLQHRHQAQLVAWANTRLSSASKMKLMSVQHVLQPGIAQCHAAARSFVLVQHAGRTQANAAV